MPGSYEWRAVAESQPLVSRDKGDFVWGEAGEGGGTPPPSFPSGSARHTVQWGRGPGPEAEEGAAENPHSFLRQYISQANRCEDRVWSLRSSGQLLPPSLSFLLGPKGL
jgi:hypothetical protein